MKYKLNGKYVQIWNDRGVCVSLGTADGLVSSICFPDQTKSLRDKLTKLYKGDIVRYDQNARVNRKRRLSSKNTAFNNRYARSSERDGLVTQTNGDDIFD